MAERPKPSQAELDLPLASVLSHARFPGRSMLGVREVADALGIDEKHVISLINEGDRFGFKLDAIEITGRGNKSSREHWRIPVSGYDAYIRHAHNKRRDA
jgi:hypothetical protein